MTGERVNGKVARILTAQELVLNRGTADGVQVGMRFAILYRNGREIRDPDTGESLGSVDLPKTFVKVTQVYERLCVARTFRQFVIPGRPATGFYGLAGTSVMSSLKVMGDPGEPERVTIETLKTDESVVRDELDESESFVKIGDPAIQVVGDEYAGFIAAEINPRTLD